MARLYQCNSLTQAHVIRCYLLEHDIETHVVHEFGGTLWPSNIAGCALVIHETDLEFMCDALADPRIPVLDDDVAAAEPSSAIEKPITHLAGFFPGTMLTGSALAVIFGCLVFGFELLDWIIYGRTGDTRRAYEFRSAFNAGDFAALAVGGFIGGLLASCAIVAAREFRTNDDGEFSTETRLAIFGVLVLVSPIGTFILVMLFWYIG